MALSSANSTEQVARLLKAGAVAGQPVTMVAAGSSDPDALDALALAASYLAEAWGSEVRWATLGGLGPRPAEVMQPGDAVPSWPTYDDSVWPSCKGGFGAKWADVETPNFDSGMVARTLLPTLPIGQAAGVAHAMPPRRTTEST